MARKTSIPNYSKPRMSNLNVRTRVMTEAEIQKIKEEATQQAIRIVEERYNAEEIRREGYNEAISNATKYFILCGCKVLHDEFGYGYKRLARFIDAVANLEIEIEEGTTTLEALEKWLDIEVGMILEGKDVDEEMESK